MAEGTCRIRLRSGTKEIEIEASSRADVDALLERWWPNSAPDEDEQTSGTDKAPQPSRKAARRKSQAAKNGKPDVKSALDADFDANKVANEVKQSNDFSIIEKKIILTSGDWFNKTAFVLCFTGKPLTSGQVHRVLIALQIKSDAATISKILKKHLSKFITSGSRQSGGPPATYELSAAAKAEFVKWLNTDAGK